jgi:hypothetical protein
MVLADGMSTGPYAVADGAITLDPDLFPDGASVVHVGLSYASELELLDLPPGEGRSRIKIVKAVAVEYEGAFGGSVGESFEGKLEEIRKRQVVQGSDPIPLETGIVKVPIEGAWNLGGRAVLRQTDPLPVTLLAVTREVEYGGG